MCVTEPGCLTCGEPAQIIVNNDIFHRHWEDTGICESPLNLLRHTLTSFSMLTIGLGNVWAQDSSISLGKIHNCTELKIPEFDEAMTRQEKVAILDTLLNDVLNRTGGCETVASSSASGGSGSASGQLRGASQASSASTGIMEREGSEESQAGSEMGQAATESASLNDSPNAESQSGGQRPPQDNGKTPEDIPPADSDSVIERQLRELAIAETDPVKQAKLWNKYREYKGLPKKLATFSSPKTSSEKKQKR